LSLWISPADVADLIPFCPGGTFLRDPDYRVAVDPRTISDLEERVEERTVALRESQERLRSVVAELQHRTRNLISVVGTMAKGTLRTIRHSTNSSSPFGPALKF
jgi:hypothetical protein